MSVGRPVLMSALLLALLAPNIALQAAEPTIQGRVTTPDGQTSIKHLPVIIRPVIIRMEDPPSETQASATAKGMGAFVATTDETGRYELHGLAPGRYTVTPANRPDLEQEVVVEPVEPSRRWWPFSDRGTGKPVTVEDFHLSPGKQY